MIKIRRRRSRTRRYKRFKAFPLFRAFNSIEDFKKEKREVLKIIETHRGSDGTGKDFVQALRCSCTSWRFSMAAIHAATFYPASYFFVLLLASVSLRPFLPARASFCILFFTLYVILTCTSLDFNAAVR